MVWYRDVPKILFSIVRFCFTKKGRKKIVEIVTHFTRATQALLSFELRIENFIRYKLSYLRIYKIYFYKVLVTDLGFFLRYWPARSLFYCHLVLDVVETYFSTYLHVSVKQNFIILDHCASFTSKLIKMLYRSQSSSSVSLLNETKQ